MVKTTATAVKGDLKDALFPVNIDLTFPLLHIVESDDVVLEQNSNAEWFSLLRRLRWWEYRDLAAAYYASLFGFNEQAVRQRQEREAEPSAEGKEEARLRLLFDRPTMQAESRQVGTMLFEPPAPPERSTIDPETLAPGVVPLRYSGRQPKDFFSLFKAFTGVVMMGRPPEPEEVHHHLVNNPSFARACGFTQPKPNGLYRSSDIPSLRKLEQFDQIMTTYGLWDRCKWDEVKKSLAQEAIQPERELVHDTTHFPAASSFETVEWEDEQGKVHRKSQSKVTKVCGCEDKEQCPHPFQLCDDGAGTVVKGTGQMYWAHKASVLAFPRQGIPLDVVAMTDAASHDSNSVIPHLERLRERVPEALAGVNFLLDDAAADDPKLRKQVNQGFQLTLRSSLNPRRRKPVTEDLPKGMSRLTPYGELICDGEQSLEYLGVRWKNEVFLYGPPRADDNSLACLACSLKKTCCPHATAGRHVTLPFDCLPHINPEDPPMAKRFQVMMTLRPSVERVIKLIKRDLGDPYLTRRSNASFQARLDKTLIAFHLLLRG